MRKVEKLLIRVRPAPVAAVLKRAAGIRRRVAKTTSGLSFFIDPVSHFGNEILEKGTYEETLTQTLVSLLRGGDVFVDLGANEGYFSVLAASLVGPGRVLSVEPQSALGPILRENFRLNAVQNAKIVSVAASDVKGVATLHIPAGTNWGAASFHRHWRFGNRKETVTTVPMDLLIESEGLGKVRMVKIDCEGAEQAIIRGATKWIQRRDVDYWAVDFHVSISGKSAPSEIDSIFRLAGYTLSELKNGLWLYHLPEGAAALNVLGRVKEIAPLG